MSDLKIVNFRLKKDIAERLIKATKEQQTTVTAVIRESLMKYLKKVEK